MKFHASTPVKIPAGQLAQEFLRELKTFLLDLHTKEMTDIRAAAKAAFNARRSGREMYVFTHGHAIMNAPGGPCDPGFFKQINAGWFDIRKDIKFQPGDFVYAIGFDRLFTGETFHDFDRKVRTAGVRLVWSIANCRPGQILELPPDEILIDQQWKFGDSAVTLPGYAIKILPVGGVISEATLWMVNAELLALQEGDESR
jgi:hypothetical protein